MKVRTDLITILYVCKSCGVDGEQPLDEIVENGTAICPECGADMVMRPYVSIEGAPDDNFDWIHVGAEVFWNDPDEGKCSQYCNVTKILDEVIVEDSVIIVLKTDGTTMEVFARELT